MEDIRYHAEWAGIGMRVSEQSLSAERGQAVVESALLAEETNSERARVRVLRAIGSVLENCCISIADPRTVVVEADHSQ